MDYLEAPEHSIPNYFTCRVTMPSNAACNQSGFALYSYVLKEHYSDYPGGRINGS